VIEKLEPEQISEKNSSSERIDEESENIKLKRKSESAVFITETPKKQCMLDTIGTQTKYNIANEKMISSDAVNNADCSFAQKASEEQFSASIGNGTVLFAATPGRSSSNSKVLIFRIILVYNFEIFEPKNRMSILEKHPMNQIIR
jgi:hypothetical protein